MKNLIFSLFCLTLLLSATATWAETPQGRTLANMPLEYTEMPLSGMSPVTLGQSQYDEEIRLVNEKAHQTELSLLAELKAAAADEDVTGIVRSIEHNEVDRIVGILEVQAKYARMGGMFNLEMRLQARIVAVLEEEAGTSP